MNKIIAYFFFTIITFSTFSQNKKEQIETLKIRTDSLTNVIHNVSVNNPGLALRRDSFINIQKSSKRRKIISIIILLLCIIFSYILYKNYNKETSNLIIL